MFYLLDLRRIYSTSKLINFYSTWNHVYGIIYGSVKLAVVLKNVYGWESLPKALGIRRLLVQFPLSVWSNLGTQPRKGLLWLPGRSRSNNGQWLILGEWGRISELFVMPQPLFMQRHNKKTLVAAPTYLVELFLAW